MTGPSLDLAVNVLTMGNWPSFTSSPCHIPPIMTKSLEHFKLFYGSKYSGRTLSWQHSLDQCTLKAAFPSAVKELNVSLYQAITLMAFNGEAVSAKLAYKDILTLTGLGRLLQILACN